MTATDKQGQGDSCHNGIDPRHPAFPSREKNVADFRGKGVLSHVPPHVLERLERAFAEKEESEEVRCVGCGELFERPVGRGRPRLYCPDCVPAVGVAGAAEMARRWRALNPEAVEAYNRARRVSHERRPCVECGEEFTPNRVDRLVCSERCRGARKRRQAKAREAA
jgi:hypothetical protein